ncbi:MAG: hypothetical protein AAF222_13235 [Pseudomonadota bacterium]
MRDPGFTDGGASVIVKLYRWAVFLLAGFYTSWMVLLDADYTAPAGPFRFLTIWALLLSFFCASRMMALVEHRSENDWPALVAVTATLNFMVVFLYWRLYLADPGNVTGSGGPPDPWVQYYIHALGPLLQWGDMLFVHRNVRRLWRALFILLCVVVAYVLWTELIVGPLNDTPVGMVTSGLPYPFLNDLELSGRAQFYGQTAVSAVLVLLLVFGLSHLTRQVLGDASAEAR